MPHTVYGAYLCSALSRHPSEPVDKAFFSNKEAAWECVVDSMLTNHAIAADMLSYAEALKNEGGELCPQAGQARCEKIMQLRESLFARDEDTGFVLRKEHPPTEETYRKLHGPWCLYTYAVQAVVVQDAYTRKR